MRLTREDKELIAACRDRPNDLYGDKAKRVCELMDRHNGCPLYPRAHVGNLADLVDKLSHKSPKRKTR